MNERSSLDRVSKLFSPWMLVLCACGLFLNITLSKLIIFLDLPLYVDNVGSILTAALGGALPGMMVGFISNVLGSISEPISMYYGILTVMIAWLTSAFSRKELLRKWYGLLIAVVCFVLIGGGIGSIMTWFLYGGGIGGIAEPYALALNHNGFPPFFAQLTADIMIDIPDKLVTVGIVYVLLCLCPRKMLAQFPYGYLYNGKKEKQSVLHIDDVPRQMRYSVNIRVINVFVLSVSFISIMSVAISSVYHHQRLIQNYMTMAEEYANHAADCLDGDRIEDFLEEGENAAEYNETKKRLTEVYNTASQLKYLYVYSVQQDGCHVVFDMDTPELAGDPVGTIVPSAQYYSDNEELFLAGEAVPPEYSRGEEGRLITGYTVVQNSQDRTVAYVGADIDINAYILDMMTYIIQIVSVLFAISVLITAFALWYVTHHITAPIQDIIRQSKALDSISPEQWLDSDEWKNRKVILTGDELEELYRTVCRLEENASKNVKKLIETEQQLLQTKELERMNQELALTIKKADDANRAKTDFLSRMSHDIRTPLNAILGTTALAKDELDNPQAMEEALDTILSSGQFLLGLINDILDINKIENGNLELRPEPFPASQFISAIESAIRPLAEKSKLSFSYR